MSKSSNGFSVVSLDHPVNKAVTSEVVHVSPEIARDYLSQNRHNRNIRQSIVSRYERDMTSGNWRMSGEAIKFDWNGRLIDGQHRLHAVIEANETVAMLVVRNLDPKTQLVVDAGAKRTGADALRFDGAASSNQTILSAAARVAVSHEAGLLKNSASQAVAKLTNSEIVEWVRAHPEIEGAAALAARTAKDIGCQPSTLAYAVMLLADIDELDAHEFIESMAEFRTEGAADPRATLLSTFSRLRRERVRITPAMQLSLIFRAWNAWRAGRKVGKLQTGANGRPVGIPEPK